MQDWIPGSGIQITFFRHLLEISRGINFFSLLPLANSDLATANFDPCFSVETLYHQRYNFNATSPCFLPPNRWTPFILIGCNRDIERGDPPLGEILWSLVTYRRCSSKSRSAISIIRLLCDRSSPNLPYATVLLVSFKMTPHSSKGWHDLPKSGKSRKSTWFTQIGF